MSNKKNNFDNLTDKELEQISSSADLLGKDGTKRIIGTVSEKINTSASVNQPTEKFKIRSIRKGFAAALIAAVLMVALTITAFASSDVRNFVNLIINGKSYETEISDNKDGSFKVTFKDSEPNTLKKDGERAEVSESIESYTVINPDSTVSLFLMGSKFDVTEDVKDGMFVKKCTVDDTEYLVEIAKTDKNTYSTRAGVIS